MAPSWFNLPGQGVQPSQVRVTAGPIDYRGVVTERPARRFPADLSQGASHPVAPPNQSWPLDVQDSQRPDIRVSRTLARLMDDLVRVPGTNIGLGLDALVGLVPGIGDAAGTALSGAIMLDAIRARIPIHILLRMGWNLVLDAGLSAVPFVGDFADVAHRANRKNLRLLERAVVSGDLVRTGHVAYLVRAVAVLVVSLSVCIAGAVFSLWVLWRILTG